MISGCIISLSVIVLNNINMFHVFVPPQLTSSCTLLTEIHWLCFENTIPFLDVDVFKIQIEQLIESTRFPIFFIFIIPAFCILETNSYSYCTCSYEICDRICENRSCSHLVVIRETLV